MSKELTPKRSNNHEVSPDHNSSDYDPAYVYPYPVIPVKVRSTLERSLQIDNIDQATPDSSREMARRVRLDDINKEQEGVRTYCRNELNDQAYLAAALGEVMDQYCGIDSIVRELSRPDTGTNGKSPLRSFHKPSIRAGQALADFFRRNSPDKPHSHENVYIAGLLQDRMRLNEFKDMVRTGEHTTDYNISPSNDEWLTAPTVTDADTLFRAVSTINIESILISGAEILQQLNSHSRNDRTALDAIRYSEQIIAPIAEVTGFDALALSLNDLTKTLRLRYGGRPDLLIKANAIHDRFRAIDRSQNIAENTRDAVNDIIGQIFGKVDGLSLRLPVDFNDSNHSVYGDADKTMYPTDDGEVSASVRYRLKSVGSLAWKMLQGEKKGKDTNITSMDILGITMVTRNEEDQAKLFQELAMNMYATDNHLQPYPAPSKTSAIHVRGTSDYVDRMTKVIGVAHSVDRRVAASKDELHLGKVTGFDKNLPFEIQCVTREYRNSMQTGQLAHIIYKNGGKQGISHDDLQKWTKLLTSIRERRKRIGEPDLIGSYANDVEAYNVNAGANTAQANEFIDRLLSLDDIVNRTVGFVAVSGVESSTHVDTTDE